jgi:NTE family protein
VVARRLGRPDATFADLQRTGRELYVVGANLGSGFAEVFSAERHADMPLTSAVRISMSIPLLFAAVRYGPGRDVYVDGGVVLNYPVKLFDRMKYIAPEERVYAARMTPYYEEGNRAFLAQRPNRSPYVYNRQTLGLRLDTREQIGLYRYDERQKSRSIGHLGDYARALTNALMAVQENQHLHSDDWQRSVYIDTKDVGTTDFDITEERKAELIRQGEQGVNEYFKWFTTAEKAPENRIPREPEIRPDGPMVEVVLKP